MSEKVVIRITPQGKVVVEGIGFVGPSCAPIIAKLTAALGVVEEEQRKPEFEQVELETPDQETVAEGGW